MGSPPSCACAGDCLQRTQSRSSVELAASTQAGKSRCTVTVLLLLPDRYLLLEFPVLTVQDPPQRIAELGCGCGSALLPILKVRSWKTYPCNMLRLRIPLSACCECRTSQSRQHQVCKLLLTQGACDMQENRQATVIATDISPTAVRLFDTAAARAGISSDRIQAFPCNSADPAVGDSMLAGRDAT